MEKLLERKWMVGSITLIIALTILIINFAIVYKQNNALKKEIISNMNIEWYQLYRLSQIIDQSYIKNDYQQPEKFQLYVNQTCYHFTMTGRPNELTVSMRNLLIQAYDLLFHDLSNEKGPLNKDEASALLKGMNDDLMLISKDIINMQDKEKLLEIKSKEFIKTNAHIKIITEKYTKLVDDYFRRYQ